MTKPLLPTCDSRFFSGLQPPREQPPQTDEGQAAWVQRQYAQGYGVCRKANRPDTFELYPLGFQIPNRHSARPNPFAPSAPMVSIPTAPAPMVPAMAPAQDSNSWLPALFVAVPLGLAAIAGAAWYVLRGRNPGPESVKAQPKPDQKARAALEAPASEPKAEIPSGLLRADWDDAALRAQIEGAKDQIGPIQYEELRGVTEFLQGDILPGSRFVLGKPSTYERELLTINFGEDSRATEFLRLAGEIGVQGRREGRSLFQIANDVADAMDGLYAHRQDRVAADGIQMTVGHYYEDGGCCRHRAALLQMGLQNAGIKSRYVRGLALGGGMHAWVEVSPLWNDQYDVVLDPNLHIRGKKVLISGAAKGHELFGVTDERTKKGSAYSVNLDETNMVWRRRSPEQALEQLRAAYRQECARIVMEQGISPYADPADAKQSIEAFAAARLFKRVSSSAAAFEAAAALSPAAKPGIAATESPAVVMAPIIDIEVVQIMQDLKAAEPEAFADLPREDLQQFAEAIKGMREGGAFEGMMENGRIRAEGLRMAVRFARNQAQGVPMRGTAEERARGRERDARKAPEAAEIFRAARVK